MTLKRIACNDNGTFGVMIHNYQPFAVTYELPWHDNKRNISCIPAETYLCKRVDSPSRGEVYELQNVPNRSHILIHIGNYKADSKGCILIGEQFGYLKGSPAVLCSKRGFDEFMFILEDIDKFWLVIENVSI
jgi:hypothetical protein